MRRYWFILVFIPFFNYAQRIFLIGDAGEPKHADKNLQLLTEKTEEATDQDVLIFLGDNLYPRGLPDTEHPERAEMEQKLIPQLEVMKNFPGHAYMIPGNHDWAQGRKNGLKRALNMELFVNQYLKDADAFLPTRACPGPIEIPLGEHATLIIINTQYLLHPWDKPDEDDFCDTKSSIEALYELQSIIKRNSGKHILIAGHHPLYSYGEHHGNFPLKTHLLPPVLGSLHPFYRRFIGNIQDVTNPKFRAIAKGIVNAMNMAEHVVYAAGHEHSLQYIAQQGHHFIVSGSGSKTTYVKQGKFSQFAKSEQGFATLQFSDDGKAHVQYWGVDNGLLFEKQLYQKELVKEKVIDPPLDFRDSTISTIASEKYAAGKGKKKWLGTNYRDIWETPIEVDVIDLATERGGLKVLKRGGGMQTKSLRLEAMDGKQYVLRSIEKYPENAIPEALKKTFAQDIVQDQISASHPYGAYIVPTLAEAAQIYHANPKPVWIPDDPVLGIHRDDFKGTLALYEERPNKEAAGESFFGRAEDVEGTEDVLIKLQEDNDNRVDQNFVVRNRLFDMWIGDWDRHDDQWRWAEFDNEGKGKTYRPIPRDRDQAFFINEGLIPKLASRKWGLPKIEGFDEEVRWAPGISQNARFFDRTFMSEPDWNDWKNEIRFLQENLTDEVIEKAISKWPEEVQRLSGPRVRTGLKARRIDMERYARELYLYLSREVEIVGSDKHEYFIIDQISDDEVKVTVHKSNKDGEIKKALYSRLFTSSETKEIRLYGRDGEDSFEVNGQPNSKINIRIIGGTDKDRLFNKTNEKIGNLKLYDRKKSTRVNGNSKGILRLSDNPEINAYDRKAFKYDLLTPLVTGAINLDDGLFIGGGFIFTKNGWRKDPFASKHTLLAKTAIATGSYDFSYKATFTDVLGKWDIRPTLLVQEPFFVNNFFGIGNESVFEMDRNAWPEDDDPVDFYRVRIRRLEGDIDFDRNIGTKAKFYVGLGFRRIQAEETENRILESLNLSDMVFEKHKYGTVKMGVSMDSRDQKVLTQNGMTAFAQVEHYEALKDFSQSFTRISGEWAFYLTTKIPSRLTIANRVGFAHNTSGDVEFFNFNKLGGRSNLRGYRRTRFYGQTSFYHNLDLRLKLFSFRSYIFPGQFGLLGFHDAGRVWVDGEDSDEWHSGTGFGVWLSPINMLVVNFNYAFGEDENLPTFGLSFFF